MNGLHTDALAGILAGKNVMTPYVQSFMQTALFTLSANTGGLVPRTSLHPAGSEKHVWG